MRILSLALSSAFALSASAVVAQTPTPQSTMPTGSAPQMSPSTLPTPSPTGQPTTGAQTAAPTGGATATAVIVQPAVGVAVFGAGGTPVGTIKSMDSQYVTLTTAKGDVKLPVAGVGPGQNGAVIGLTAAQLDAAVGQAKASQPAVAQSDPAAAATAGNATKAKPVRKSRRRR